MQIKSNNRWIKSNCLANSLANSGNGYLEASEKY